MIDHPKNHLLSFLRTGARAVGDAFRTNPRHGSRRKARIAWRAGAQEKVVHARLIDISRVGAALTTATPPPEGTLVRVRLAGSTPTPWIEADVLGVEPLDGAHRVRLRFRDPCPTIMLKSAVLGNVVPTPHTSSQDSEAVV
jgi:hypothetical protein